MTVAIIRERVPIAVVWENKIYTVIFTRPFVLLLSFRKKKKRGGGGGGGGIRAALATARLLVIGFARVSL